MQVFDRTESPNRRTHILGIHHKVPLQVIKHDGVLWTVVLRVTIPNDLQRLGVEHAAFWSRHGDHSAVVDH